MKYLFDTCTISELVKKIPGEKVINWIRDCDEDSIYLSVLTLGEIQKGITKLQDETRKHKIQTWLDHDLKLRFDKRIIEITEEISLLWGTIQAESELKGSIIPTIDGLIGATAIANNLAIVTRNEKDIKLTGARIINPWNL